MQENYLWVTSLTTVYLDSTRSVSASRSRFRALLRYSFATLSAFPPSFCVRNLTSCLQRILSPQFIDRVILAGLGYLFTASAAPS